MLNVQTYLQTHTLDDLKQEFDITVREYPDIVVLNYGIKSPKFNPIVDECRSLVLEKDTWKVLSRAFDRFYNSYEGPVLTNFPITTAKCEEKLDGSIMTVWWYKDHFEVCSRSMAFAEGECVLGGTFRQLFDKAMAQSELNFGLLYELYGNGYTFIFELTTPENRIVTRYSDYKLTLIGSRNLTTGDEVHSDYLDIIAKTFNLGRPKVLPFNTIEDVINSANSLDQLDEGFVLVAECAGSFKRIKVKNKKYLAIAHLVNNGQISVQRLLTLVMSNSADEFCGFFPEYKNYVDFVVQEWVSFLDTVKTMWMNYSNIENQKEFAVTIMSACKVSLVHGCLFMMKKGKTFEEVTTIEAVKVVKNLNLKQKFEAKFNMKLAEEEETN